MKKIILSGLFWATCVSAFAAPEWKLKKENSYLKIYTAAADNSDYRSVWVQCSVRGTMAQIIAVLFDIDRQKEWVYSNKQSTLLKQVGDNELIYYSEVNVPWPCINRDYIAHIKATQLSPNVVTVVSYGDPGYIPTKDGIVRVKKSSAKWTLTAMGNNSVKIDYVVQFDPGGGMPAWLSNMFVTKGPYNTFEQLQGRIDMPAYKNAHFDFIKE